MKKVNDKINKNLFYFLLVLAFLRPSLDILSQYEFKIHFQLPAFNINAVLGGLVFLFISFFLIKNFKLIYKTPLFYSISIFLSLSFLSIFYSSDYLLSLKEFIRLSSIFWLYFLTYQLIRNKKDWSLLLKTILLSYCLPAIFAFFQFLFHKGLSDDFGGFDRIYGTFAHPNPFAFYTFFILGLLLSLELSKYYSKSNIFRFNWVFIVFLTITLFFTYTRSAIVCLLIFILFFGIFKYRKLLFFSGLALAFAYLLSNIFQERIWELISLDPYGSIVWRFRLWKDMLVISLWQPWFGYGIGTFTQLVEYYRGFSWGSLEAHNDYLKIFVENGILGLISYFSIIVSLFWYLVKIFRKTINKDRVITLGLISIFFSLFLASFFDNILRETALQWNLWIILAAWLKIKNPHR